jgi:membrane protease YdiL (CAAX protease family)
MSEPHGDRLARDLRGFGPIGILSILLILLGNLLFLPLSAVLVMVWAWRSDTPWSAIGLVRPRSWARTVTLGVVIGATLKLVLKSLVLPLFHVDPINHAFHRLVGNPALVPFMLYQLVIGAGFGEEVVFRGWMFERLGAVLGGSRAARLAIVLITSLVFGAAHLHDQGLPGAGQAVITGIVFSAMYLATGSLALPMVAHASFDLVAYAIIYWNLETRVAHLVFH